MMLIAHTIEHCEPGGALRGVHILTYHSEPGAVGLAFNVSQMGFMSLFRKG